MSDVRAGRWRCAASALAGVLLFSGTAAAVDVSPHRAIYDLSLAQAKSSSGIVDAKGSMLVEWADSCDGWTVDQRYRLTVTNDESEESLIVVSFSTWESKDGLSYRFFIRKVRDGDVAEETRGRARLSAPGEAGNADFTQPETATIVLPRGTMFPTDHTLLLIRSADGNERFVTRRVFDGDELEGPSEVTAAIGQAVLPAGDAKPLRARRGWPIRLAFYKPDANGSEPDYEVGMKLLENGVADGMTLDYGDLVVRAKLREVEALEPSC
ncbi:MAG: DUF1849 family protein [Alphaproteobacteria bacterium]|nr:DUF1849 family protein [Alphaproteobacteria bacterium]